MSHPIDPAKSRTVELTAHERAWADEIARRLAEYRSGKVRAIPASEVFAEARAMLG